MQCRPAEWSKKGTRTDNSGSELMLPSSTWSFYSIVYLLFNLFVNLQRIPKIFPQKVQIGFRYHNVKQYIPPPTRCYNCNKYGHTTTYCTTKTKCSKCGNNHQYDQCTTSTNKCSNCGGSHSAAYKGCPHNKLAKNITAYKVQNNTSFTQAAKQINKPSQSVTRTVITKTQTHEHISQNFTTRVLIKFNPKRAIHQ